MRPLIRKFAVLFAGGGTGGHIYPNVAVAERYRERIPDGLAYFLVSNRPGDALTMDALGLPYATCAARPLPGLRRPWDAVRFVSGWQKALREVSDVLKREQIDVVVATGGFVSGPAVIAAARLGIVRVLVNLDAVPGQANRHLGRVCNKVFSTYASPLLPTAERIGLPLRRISVGDVPPREGRRRLGLHPDRPLLFVTGATHGAESMIRAMLQLLQSPERAATFEGWQVLHQCGTFDVDLVQRAYDAARIEAKVVPYCDQMGLAWSGAEVVLSRAGAGSVAEAWANAAPTIFMPNPYHRDQHQRHNAEPLVAAGGAEILADEIDATRNARALGPVLERLMRDPDRRDGMRRALQQTRPPDGAARVAEWIGDRLAGPSSKRGTS